ncbi:MAG: hypothetical protein HYW50_03420, partial [Candidatus Diapherotrites archaeon]|nr:hypothetical protein [Candidatus Diapherotrites archaeon]
LLEPSFPKFYKNWAYKVIINGKLKPTTPPGTYAATFEVEIPPEEFQKEWKFEHRTLYINAAQSLKPSGSAIQFNITVK